MNRLNEIKTILLQKKLPIEICNKIIYKHNCLQTPSSICIKKFLININKKNLVSKHIFRNYLPEINNHNFNTIEIIEIKFFKNCFNKRVQIGFHYPKVDFCNGKKGCGIKYFVYFSTYPHLKSLF